MKILFKQISKTFIKNSFLILGASLLTTTIAFVSSTAINISSVYNISYSNLNEKGNKAEVVSSDIDIDVGGLDFSYKLSNEPISIFVSTLKLNKEKDPSGLEINKYSRSKNTILPFSYDQMFKPDGSSIKKGLNIDTGIKYFPNALNLDSMFTIDDSSTIGWWNYMYEQVVQVITGSNLKDFISCSFVDNDGNVIFNPYQLMFSKYGIPVMSFDKGNLSYNLGSFYFTFSEVNKEYVTANKEIYDANGFGIFEPEIRIYNNNQKSKAEGLHKYIEPLSYKKSKLDFLNLKTEQYYYSFLRKFIKPKKVVPYEFNLNLNSNNSYGLAKQLITKNPEIYNKAVKKIISDFEEKPYFDNITLPEQWKNEFGEISSAISYDEQTQTIKIAIDEQCFINPISDENPQDQITKNKSVFLNFLKLSLSSLITNSLKDIIINDFHIFLQGQEIDLKAATEYSYKDSSTDNELLFVPKDIDEKVDKLVIYDGSIAPESDFVTNVKKLFKFQNQTISYESIHNMYLFLDSFDDSLLPKKDPSKKKILNNDYACIMLVKYCLKKLEEWVKNNGILQIEQIKYFKILNKLLKEPGLPEKKVSLTLQDNKVSFKFNPNQFFLTIYSPLEISRNILDQYFVIISNSYAYENKKRYLPSDSNSSIIVEYIEKIDELKKLDSKNLEFNFAAWLDTINDERMKVLSPFEIYQIFSNEESLFNVWMKKLDSNYKMKYKNQELLITGFGLSPDYALPIISDTSPIPNPKTQAIVYVSSLKFKSFNANQIDLFSYIKYYSDKFSAFEIVKKIHDFSISKYGTDLFNVNFVNQSPMVKVAMRSFFPKTVNDGINILLILLSIFLSILVMVIIYFLIKSLFKNLLQPMAICLANGIPIWKLFVSCLINLGIVTTISSLIGYFIAYACQASLTTILNSIWFIPFNLMTLNPLIGLGLGLLVTSLLGVVLYFMIKNKFTNKSVNNILANTSDIKVNKLTSIMRIPKLKIPYMAKLSLGFSSINIKKLCLLSILGSLTFGSFVSSLMINQKFNEAKVATQNARKYNYEYQLRDVNESTGLFKSQTLENIGWEDRSVGIYSIFSDPETKVPNGKYPYSDGYIDWNNELWAKTLPMHGDENDLIVDSNKRLTNMVLPSYSIYEELTGKKTNTLFNSSASLLLLDMKTKFADIITINIWDVYVKPHFPGWLQTQLESQLVSFKTKIMEYYGEWFSKFIDIRENSENRTLIQKVGNGEVLELKNIENNKAGIYYAKAKTNKLNRNNALRTKSFFVWPNSKQIYWDKEVTKEKRRYEIEEGSNLSIKATEFYKYDVTKTFEPNIKYNPLNHGNITEIEWYFVPAYNNNFLMSDEKCVEGNNIDPYKIKLSQDFLKLVTTIYNDKKVTTYDSKISFGIVPFNENVDEKATIIRTKVKNKNINIFGIKEDSKLFGLYNKGENIENLLLEDANPNDNVYPIIINHGASMANDWKVGTIIDAIVLNDALNPSISFLNKIVPLKSTPLQNKVKFKVVAINDDSYGERYYINQKLANKILNLNNLEIYCYLESPKINTIPNNKSIVPNINNYDDPTFPFNTIVSNSNTFVISNNSIPFYTSANVWTPTFNINDFNALDSKFLYATLVTKQPKIIEDTINAIKQELNPNINISGDPQKDRETIINYFSSELGSSAATTSLIKSNTELLDINLIQALPMHMLYEMFDITSTLSTSLIVINSLMIVPLLIFVLIVTLLSIITELTKQLLLMKVLGYSDRNVIFTIGLMLIPVFALAFGLGIGVMFGGIYAIQSIIYKVTQIFISSSVQLSLFLIGIGILVVIMLILLAFIAIVLKKNKLENSIKF